MHATILPTPSVCMSTLRIAPSGACAPEPRSDAAAEPWDILIVDDDADLAEVVADVLGRAGYTVVVAPDSVVGLSELHTRRFTLVLSDYRMPGRTGVDMLREADAEGLLDGVAVLLVSADEIVGIPWRVLRKPFLYDELLDEVHRALDTRRLAG